MSDFEKWWASVDLSACTHEQVAEVAHLAGQSSAEQRKGDFDLYVTEACNIYDENKARIAELEREREEHKYKHEQCVTINERLLSDIRCLKAQAGEQTITMPKPIPDLKVTEEWTTPSTPAAEIGKGMNNDE